MTRGVLKYLCVCEGWLTAAKSLHWNSSNLSQHKLCEDIAERIADFQDQISEIEQSITGNLAFNRLKPVEYKIKSLKKFVEDVIDGTNDFYKKVKRMGEKYVGMASDCESFMSDMQRNLYLVNFTLKEDFKRNYRNKLLESKQEAALNARVRKFSEVVNEAIYNVLSKKHVNESVDEVEGGDYKDQELNYTHFAVNKQTNLVVDGWDYSGYDTKGLASDKKSYFYDDLMENGFNPKMYRILSFKACQRAGLDPNDSSNWSNTGVFALPQEKEMKQNGKNFLLMARKQHPDWFVD